MTIQGSRQIKYEKQLTPAAYEQYQEKSPMNPIDQMEKQMAFSYDFPSL